MEVKSKRDAYLRRTYGLTERDFNELLEKQDFKCPICLGNFGGKRKPCVDHDHVSGVVRGILCLYCNLRVIGRHRDPDLLLRASAYLSGPGTRFVAPKKSRRKRKRRASHKRRKTKVSR